MPISHVFAAVFFFIFSFACVYVGYSMYKDGEPEAIEQGLVAIPFLIAFFAVVSSSAKWIYYYCAVLLFLVAAGLFASVLFIFFVIPRSTFEELFPTTIGSLLLFWLFYSFTFGNSSKQRFATAAPQN